MARTPVVIEINNYEIKGLAFKSGIAGRSFFQSESALLNPQESAAVQAAEFVASKYPDAWGVHFNVPYDSLFTRELTFPFADRRKVREVLPFELEPVLPYELSEVVYDSYLTTNASNTQTHAIVTGTRKDILINFLEQFRLRAIPVLGIYAPHDALFRLHPFVGLESCIMLHVSRMVSVIVVVVNGDWRFARVMPVGYDWLIAKLKTKWKTDNVETHRLLLSLPASLEDSDETETFRKTHKMNLTKFRVLQDSIVDFTKVISKELDRSLRNIQIESEPMTESEQVESVPINPHALHVALSSDLNNAVVIENQLAKTLNHDVSMFPYERTPLALLNREHLVTMGGAYSQSVAGKINLLKDDLKRWVVKSQGTSLKITIAIGMLGIIAFLTSFFVDLNRRSRALKEWESRQTKLFQDYFGSEKIPANSTAVSTASELVQKERLKTEIFMVFLGAPKLSAVLVQLHQNLSTTADFDLNSFSYSDRGIEITGSVPDYARLEEVKRSLSKSTLLTDVKSSNENSMPGPNGQNRIKFSLFCKVKKVDQVGQK